MDITSRQIIQRAKRIAVVEKALNMVKNQKRLLDKDKFIILICEQFVCTERMAREYFKIARSRIKGRMVDREWAEKSHLFDLK